MEHNIILSDPDKVAEKMGEGLEKQCRENGFPGGVRQRMPKATCEDVGRIIAGSKHKQK